jgi:hypothetical protein
MILGSCGSEYENYNLLGLVAIHFGKQVPMFWRNLLPLNSSYPEDGGRKFQTSAKLHSVTSHKTTISSMRNVSELHARSVVDCWLDSENHTP